MAVSWPDRLRAGDYVTVMSMGAVPRAQHAQVSTISGVGENGAVGVRLLGDNDGRWIVRRLSHEGITWIRDRVDLAGPEAKALLAACALCTDARTRWDAFE